MSETKSAGNAFTHPLSGTDLRTLAALVRYNRPIPLKYLPKILAATLSASARWPVCQIERVMTDRLIEKMPPMPPPIFIVGHWRSGTTHLGNALNSSPEFGCVTPLTAGLPWEMLTIGRTFRRLLEGKIPEDRLIDRVPVTPVSPQEDEVGIANMLHFSFFHALYFPARFGDNFNKALFFDGCTQSEIEAWKRTSVYFLKKVSIQQNHKRLINRNPAYTTRVQLVKELWPGAKFIHIYRNPFHLFPSMKNFYKKLFPVLALQDYSGLDIEEIVLSTFSRMMDILIEESAGLAPEEYVELSFEEFEQAPLAQLEKVYSQLRLDGFDKAEPHFRHYLSSVQGYKKNEYPDNAHDQRLVERHWGKYLDHWGYRPGSSMSAPSEQ